MALLQSPKTIIKTLVITVSNLHLAIPLPLIAKVIKTPMVLKSGNKWMGVAQADQDSLLVLDLYHKIYGQENPQPAQHLVILKTPDRHVGIPVVNLPSMMDIAVADLRPLPADYRDRDTLGIASHLIAAKPGTQAETVFLLDMDRILQTA
jgi:chemotaxis signal transduction protein